MQSLSKFRTPPCSKTVGIEWEMLVPCDPYWESGSFYGFFYCTTDGSIDAPYKYVGREFVSQPLQPKWLVKELARLNKKLSGNFMSNESCGIHVHVSRKWATAERIISIDAFLRKLTDDEYLESFGRSPNWYSRHQSYTAGPSRYMALNVENKATVEFRVFRSGDLKWAQYCVLLVEYIMENAKHLNKDAFFAFVDSHKPT